MTTLRVLVAEDDDDHRYLTVRALRRAVQVSTEVLEARDGEEPSTGCSAGGRTHTLQQVAAYWTRNSELPSSRADRTS